MIPEMKRLAVNWQDGMKVNTDHLVALENFIRDGIRDSISLLINSYNFGLLPAVPGTPSPLKLTCDTISGNQIKVVLIACRAITAGGIRIERREEENALSGLGWIDCIHPITKSSEDKLDIVISVDLFSRKAIGDPDPQESPPRRPYVVPEYTLKVHPKGTPLNQVNELKVGEIGIESGVPKLSEKYIPPCTTVNCYAPLLELYRSFKTGLKVIDDGAVFVLQKLRSDKAPEETDVEILHHVQFLIQQIVFFGANNLEWYSRVIENSSPLFFAEYFIRFAKIISTVLKCMDDTSKHSLLNHFRIWGPEFHPGNFEKALDETLNMDYDHLNIRAAIDKISDFLMPLTKLFEVLPQREFKGIERGIIEDIGE